MVRERTPFSIGAHSAGRRGAMRTVLAGSSPRFVDRQMHRRPYCASEACSGRRAVLWTLALLARPGRLSAPPLRYRSIRRPLGQERVHRSNGKSRSRCAVCTRRSVGVAWRVGGDNIAPASTVDISWTEAHARTHRCALHLRLSSHHRRLPPLEHFPFRLGKRQTRRWGGSNRTPLSLCNKCRQSL